MAKKKFSEFWTQTLSSALGTIIGIIVTFGTTFCLQHCEQRQMERTAALMVIHNLEEFTDQLEDDIEDMESTNSLISSVWSRVGQFDKVPDDTLQLFIEKVFVNYTFVATDNTAESIFSTNIDTWKSIGCSEFIEVAGMLFSVKGTVTRMRNEMYSDKRQIYDELMITTTYNDHPAQNAREAATMIFNSAKLVCFIKKQDKYLIFMKNALKTLREHVEECKQLMNVSNAELKTFGENNGEQNK